MDNPAIPQQLKVLLLWGAGLLFAIFLGWNIGSENYRPLLLGTLIFVVASIGLFSGRYFWVLTVASSFLGGIFPILGGQFTPFQILMAIGIVKFLIGDVVLRRTRIKVGSRFDVFMIAGFMGILTLHALHDRFGMRFLGSQVWGGRNYVNVYVGLAAFFVIQSLPMRPQIWARLPYVVLAVSSFDLFIAIITTIFPKSIYIIYPFYSAVSAQGIGEILGVESDVAVRIGTFGNFGFIIITLVLASVPLQQILNPKNLHRFICLIVGSLAVLYSGFRSAVLNTLIVTLVAGIRDLKFAALALLPFLAFLLFGLSFANSQIIHLPKQIQRGLAFIPGKWDGEMARDAAASNDYRVRVWTLWARQYFPAHPWLGRGFGFKSEWSKPSTYKPTAIDYRQEVEVGNIHNGFLAALDTFGIVGTVFFVLWNLRVFICTFRASSHRNQPEGFALRFLALFLSVSIASYWIGAQSVGSFLPQQFALASVFLRLQQLKQSESFSRRIGERTLAHDVRTELAPA